MTCKAHIRARISNFIPVMLGLASKYLIPGTLQPTYMQVDGCSGQALASAASRPDECARPVPIPENVFSS